jgi:primary-amine oxidase
MPNAQAIAGARSALALPVLLAGAMLCLAAPSLAAPGGCSPGHAIDETLPTGARWQACWEIRSEEGVVFSNLWYNGPGEPARKVLAEAALSQIHTSDDDGASPELHVTGAGLGGTTLRDLGAADCPLGTRLDDAGRDVLCQQVDDVGFLYKYYSTRKQSQALRLSHVSQLGDVVYVVQWRFLDSGGIEPAILATGRVPRTGSNPLHGWPIDGVGTIGLGRVHNYVWRLAFDLAENGANEIVEEIEFVANGSSERLSRNTTQLTTEAGRALDPERMRSWRVVDPDVDNADGHPISYHLDPLDVRYRYDGGAGEPWSAYGFWATVTKGCERFAVGNPPSSGCGADVAAFADGESIDGAYVTLWHTISAYRVPRAEDQPFVNAHWDGFRVIPRDWYDRSPF